ncbi:MAG: histone deacetylase family protein [Rhodobacteraceae bacterium]|jgi:acetoin utilization deacetylase AcuC-like enzyme|nr:histone deacetylase family protein [Paracoccaceae bacterium]
MKTIYSPDHVLRSARTELYGGELVPPFECPERAEFVRSRIAEVGLGPIIAPRAFGLDPVLRVHDPDFVCFLETCWTDWRAAGHRGEAIASVYPTRTMSSRAVPRNIDGRIGYYALASETAISDGTWEAALVSKDVALTATQIVLDGDRAAFGLCRPPGHHAARDQFGGYCFLNNAAIAAQYARDAGMRRVAVLDVDFHHGNGTQDIFYDRGDVFFASIHGDPRDAFPYFLGHAEERGVGEGLGSTLNIPLPPGTGYPEWCRALEAALEAIAGFGAELLVVSLGVDTFCRDPISFFKLGSPDFEDYGGRLSRLGLPTVFLLEGGYAVQEIGTNVANVLAGFSEARDLRRSKGNRR